MVLALRVHRADSCAMCAERRLWRLLHLPDAQQNRVWCVFAVSDWRKADHSIFPLPTVVSLFNRFWMILKIIQPILNDSVHEFELPYWFTALQDGTWWKIVRGSNFKKWYVIKNLQKWSSKWSSSVIFKNGTWLKTSPSLSSVLSIYNTFDFFWKQCNLGIYEHACLPHEPKFDTGFDFKFCPEHDMN